MHYRSLGETGLKVSVLGIGSSPFRHGPPEVCAELLEQAVELGVTYYDTARSYVNGEDAIGCLPPSVKDQLVVATKTGARGGNYCIQDLSRSLRTMKRDRIDVWMTHMIQTEHEYELCTELGGFCDIAASARQAGLVRATGASFHASTAVILRAIEERAFDVVMFQLNLIGRETIFGSSIASYRETLLPAARSNGVGVVVMKVLAAGELRHGANQLGFVAEAAAGRDVVGGAVRYATMNPNICTAVVGMRSTDELVSNVFAVDGVDDDQGSQFDEWTQRIEEINQGECTRCGECVDVCPEGIEIPKVMRLHDQKRFFGMNGVARYNYSAMEINASACTRCRKCTDVCPENFDIGMSLDAAHAALS
jgi:predicted aldo/keto reductase-like oxidoreductase